MTIRSAYSPPVKVAFSSSAPSMTKQSFKRECDINHIMSRFQKTGVIEFAKRFEPRYGDATGVDFRAAMQLIAEAKTMFQELPSSTRARFRNDPANFLEFVNNPANAAEARELGLLKPEEPAPVEPAPMKVQIVAQEAPKAPKAAVAE